MASDLLTWDFLKFTLSVVGAVVSLLFSVIGWLVLLELRRAGARIAALEAESSKEHDFRIRATALYPRLAGLAADD